MGKWILFGATSGIAEAVASELAARGHSLYLAGRDMQHLERLQTDLRERYHVKVLTGQFNALDFAGHFDFLNHIERDFGVVDGVLWAVGLYGCQFKAREEFDWARKIIDTNFTAAVSILSPLATQMEQRRKGVIVAISSIAGDRGRMRNYSYGSAKAALTAYLSGLRQRLTRSHVRVLTVKPGYVRTRMTVGHDGLFLVIEPEKAAADIMHAIDRKKNVVYTPWFWRWIMCIIRHIPENIFKHLSF